MCSSHKHDCARSLHSISGMGPLRGSWGRGGGSNISNRVLISFSPGEGGGGHPEKKALELDEKALKVSRAALGEDHPDVGTTSNTVALVYEAKGGYDVALGPCEKALKIARAALGEDHPDEGTPSPG